MQCKLLSLTITLLLLQPALAAADISQPKACPSIEAIKAVGVNMATGPGILGWVAVNLKNTYDTPEEWSFLIYGISALDENEAITKANNSIASFSLYSGPNIDDNNEWGCIYTSQDENNGIALATTPPMSGPPEGMISRFR